MATYVPKGREAEALQVGKNWLVIDAEGQVLGRRVTPVERDDRHFLFGADADLGVIVKTGEEIDIEGRIGGRADLTDDGSSILPTSGRSREAAPARCRSAPEANSNNSATRCSNLSFLWREAFGSSVSHYRHLRRRRLKVSTNSACRIRPLVGRERIVALGGRGARGRVAYLLCEGMNCSYLCFFCGNGLTVFQRTWSSYILARLDRSIETGKKGR